MHRRFLLLLLLGLAPIAAHAQTAGTCTGGLATADLDIGGVRARLYNNGGLFWKGAGNVYNVPKSETSVITPNAVFAQGLWLGGKVDGEIRQASANYNNWEFYPGPPLADGSAPYDCRVNDRIWRVSVDDVRAYDQTGVGTRDLLEWPFGFGAPVRDGDGVPGNYNLAGGDRPDVQGHQIAFWVMNDVSGPHNRTGSKPLGVEVRVTAIAFRSPSDALHYSTVYRYELINRTRTPITEAYFGLWTDPDLGNASDDYVGSDTTLGLGYVYNADNFDEGSDGYGTPPPALGYKLVDGPLTRDLNHDGTPDASGFASLLSPLGSHGRFGDPRALTDDFYKYMMGRGSDGGAMYACGDGAAAQYATCGTSRWMFSGDPTAPPGQRFWSEFEPTRGTSSPNAPSDRSFVMGSGPFTLAPGIPVPFTLAMVWARGADNLDSVTRMKQAAREVQAAYDATGFRNLPERIRPPAPTALPRLVSPADGAAGQPANLLLTWDPVAGATAYEVEVTGPEGAPFTVRVLETSARIPYAATPAATTTQQLPYGMYSWRVRGVNEGGNGGYSNPQTFTVGNAPVLSASFTNFLTTANAAGALTPPEYGAFAFNSSGFPNPTTNDRPDGSRQQATGGLSTSQGWGIFTFGNYTTYAQWFDRVTRGGANTSAIGPHFYEWRFTGSSVAWRAFDGNAPLTMTVPFELWNIGRTPDDPSDDVRLIPLICEAGCSAGTTNGVFDIGRDSPISGGTNDPITDAVYWYAPKDMTPGQAGYNKYVADITSAAPTGAEADRELFSRMVLMGWNMGTATEGYKMALPERGTVFRIETAPTTRPILSAPAEGQALASRQVLLAWQESASAVTLRRYVEVATDSLFTQGVLRDSSAMEANLRTPELATGQRYYWRVQLRMSSGSGTYPGYLSDWSRAGSFVTGTASGIEATEPPPGTLTLRTLAPNPARGRVVLGYGLPETSDVRFRLFDLLGREARALSIPQAAAGWHQTPLGTEGLAAGVYVVRIEVGSAAVTRTLVVVR